MDLLSSVGVTESGGVGERSIFVSGLVGLASMPRADSETPLGDADACRHSEPPSERTARKPRVNMTYYSTNTDKETYGASDGRKRGGVGDKRCVPKGMYGTKLTFKASSRLKVFPQPWHALFWDFAECRA